MEEQVTFRSIYRKISSLEESLNKADTAAQKKCDQILETMSKQLSDEIYKQSFTIQSLREENTRLKNLVQDTSRRLEEQVVLQDKEHTSRDTQIYNTIAALDKKLSKMHFDIIDNDNNLAFTYVNNDGKVEYGYVEKITVDEKTLTKTKGLIKLKYAFDTQDFSIDSNDNIKVQGLTLISGKHLLADEINNELQNAKYNVGVILNRVDQLTQRMNAVNGYLAANDFKTANPSQDSLTKFAIDRLSNKNSTITKSQIPSGTKIKNLNNGHIWVFNIVSIDGLTTYKWEDFGSDSICVATNNGTLGLITGSHLKFRGHVDINGQLSINGLEEAVTDLQLGISSILAQVELLEKRQTELEKQLLK